MSYAGSGAAVSVTLGGAVTGGDADGDVLTNIENVTGTAFNDTLTGNTLANVLTGGAGDDTLNGGTGIDALIGGAGDDVYSIEIATDIVTELGDEGYDEVKSAVSYTLLANVEKLTYTGAANFLGIGNASDNLILGGGANDTLRGMGGADTLQGGLGNDLLEGGAGADAIDGGDGTDTASYANAATGVSLDLATGSHTGEAAGDSFTDIELFAGSAFDDTMTGDANANSFQGGAGNDTLAGGAGADALDGGTGSDTADYSDSGAGVSVTLGGTVSGGDADGDVLTNIENVIGSAFDDVLVGNGFTNAFSGGAGSDTYTVDSALDVVTELVGEGSNDEVKATSSAYTLLANIETLTYIGAGNFTGTGNASDNVITGGGGNDVLQGGGGADTLDGGAGADTLDGGAGSDTVSYANSSALVNVALGGTLTGGDAADDTLTNVENVIGSAYADTLTGNAGDNVLEGGAGADTIDGSSGSDIIRDGGGDDTLWGDDPNSLVTSSDTFVFVKTDFSGSDIVEDFQNDVIQLQGYGLAQTSFQQFMDNNVTEQFGDTLISVGSGGEHTSIVLAGVAKNSLSSSNFDFIA